MTKQQYLQKYQFEETITFRIFFHEFIRINRPDLTEEDEDYWSHREFAWQVWKSCSDRLKWKLEEQK